MDIYVMRCTGKNSATDYATIEKFGNEEEAAAFVKAHTTGPSKYWSTAEVISLGEEIELNYEFNPNE